MTCIKIDAAKLNADKSPHPSFVLLKTDDEYLAKITADQRRAIKLLHHDKMNYQEIANDTGWSIGTVKSRIHRGRARIIRMRADAAVVDQVMQQPSMRAVLPPAVT
jgi:DNA-directed RNA polymerase specialized sigma24 family protein